MTNTCQKADYITPQEKRKLAALLEKTKSYISLTDKEIEDIEKRNINWRDNTLDYLQLVLDGWHKMQNWNRVLADDNLRLLSEVYYLRDKIDDIQKNPPKKSNPNPFEVKEEK